ncbi:MAG: xanthine dehydrogenase family protein molybdopterin-binding subunit [Gammaproteobacteria bacterium]|nr:MAG: xanthine dehydrogenase family protein molybdopterin-binding subunit [Gammaproteobacteria bacterium]
MSLDRRAFLKSSACVSGGLIIALHLPGCSKPGRTSGEPKTVAANAWLRIGTDNTITFLCDRSEMGQGVYTALPTLIAEELGVDLGRIRIDFAPAGDAYKNDLLGTQITGGSTSVRDAWLKLRRAGAQARTMLISAAAREWGIRAAVCRVENGFVVSPTGKRASFGACAEAAARLPVPNDVKLTDPGNFRLIGTSVRRLDTPLKVDGSARYGIDVRLPEMLYAALAQPPALGGKAASFDDSKARALPGVKAVVQTSSGIAARRDGDADAVIKSAARVVKAEYQLPLLAHATLEPQNCTADVRAEGCDIYVPTQIQQVAQQAAASAAGLKPEQVRVHTTFLGGGFGRRLDVDFVPAAVEASKAVGKPVKLLWTREDDTTHDVYRPPAFDTAIGAFDKSGKLIAWKLRLVGPSVTARLFPAVVAKSIDPFAIEAAANYPYDVPNVSVEYLRHEIGINVGYMRSVSHALNCFVAESFMDELAASARRDPLEFRRALLSKQPRYLKALELAAQEARYGAAPKGRFHGVAVMSGYDTYMAQVAEISLENGKVRVHRIVCAVDCGQVVNRDIVVAQVESGIIFGLSSTLWGEINIQRGRVQQTNFDTYRVLRINEIPRIDVLLLDNRAPPGGIGEPSTALVAPAVCNAIHAASGRRLRSLPLARHKLA